MAQKRMEYVPILSAPLLEKMGHHCDTQWSAFKEHPLNNSTFPNVKKKNPKPKPLKKGIIYLFAHSHSLLFLTRPDSNTLNTTCSSLLKPYI